MQRCHVAEKKLIGNWKRSKETMQKILKSNKDPSRKWRLTADVTIAASFSVLIAVHCGSIVLALKYTKRLNLVWFTDDRNGTEELPCADRTLLRRHG
jgi:hypothetical protein